MTAPSPWGCFFFSLRHCNLQCLACRDGRAAPRWKRNRAAKSSGLVSVWVCRISATCSIEQPCNHTPDLGPFCKSGLSSEHNSLCIKLPCSRLSVSRGITPETNPWTSWRLPWEGDKWDALGPFAEQLHKSPKRFFLHSWVVLIHVSKCLSVQRSSGSCG